MIIKRVDLINILKEEFIPILLEFPVLSRDIPDWQMTQLKQLNKDAIEKIKDVEFEKSNIIPDAKIRLSTENKNRALQSLFNVDVNKLETKMAPFKEWADDNAQFLEEFKASLVDAKYDINILNPWITDIYLLSKNVLYNISVKMSLQNNELTLSKNQKVNFNKWFESYKRFRGLTINNPFLDAAFNNVNSIVSDTEGFDINLFTEQPMYLYVTGNPEDVLNMSIGYSNFMTGSCQNIMVLGAFNQRALSNVFEEDTKIAFLILDTPFVDVYGHQHAFTAMSRMALRVGLNKYGYKKIELTRTYPDRIQHILEDILIENGYGVAGRRPKLGVNDPNIRLVYTPSIPGVENLLPKPYIDWLGATNYKFNIGIPKKIVDALRTNEPARMDWISGKSLTVQDKKNNVKISVKLIPQLIYDVYAPIINEVSEEEQTAAFEIAPLLLFVTNDFIGNLNKYGKPETLETILSSLNGEGISKFITFLDKFDEEKMKQLVMIRPAIIFNKNANKSLRDKYILDAIMADINYLKETNVNDLPLEFLYKLASSQPSKFINSVKDIPNKFIHYLLYTKTIIDEELRPILEAIWYQHETFGEAVQNRTIKSFAKHISEMKDPERMIKILQLQQSFLPFVSPLEEKCQIAFIRTFPEWMSNIKNVSEGIVSTILATLEETVLRSDTSEDSVKLFKFFVNNIDKINDENKVLYGQTYFDRLSFNDIGVHITNDDNDYKLFREAFINLYFKYLTLGYINKTKIATKLLNSPVSWKEAEMIFKKYKEASGNINNVENIRTILVMMTSNENTASNIKNFIEFFKYLTRTNMISYKKLLSTLTDDYSRQFIKNNELDENEDFMIAFYKYFKANKFEFFHDERITPKYIKRMLYIAHQEIKAREGKDVFNESKKYLKEAITDNVDVKFFRRIINSILNNEDYKSSNGELEYKKHKDQIDQLITGELETYNYPQDSIVKLSNIIKHIITLISKKKLDLQQSKGFSDIAFLKVWRKIAQLLSDVDRKYKVNKPDVNTSEDAQLVMG